VNESNIVIASNDISKGRESFLNTLNGHRLWQGISQMLEFLICGCRWDEKPVAVASSQTSNDPGSGN
jgi:hypothetical protein